MKEGKTNWKRLKEMTDDEIERNALLDKDSYCPSLEEMKHFKPVRPVKQINVKKIRERLGLSQHRFSMMFGFSMRTIQEWEQGRREPSGAVKNFLKVISKNPTAVQNALRDDQE